MSINSTPRRSSTNLLSSLSSEQIKRIETEFINYLQIKSNRFIFDASQPNHSSVQMRNRHFSEFASTTNPILSIEQVNFLYNLLLKRYSTALSRYNRQQPKPSARPETLVKLSFFNCRNSVGRSFSVSNVQRDSKRQQFEAKSQQSEQQTSQTECNATQTTEQTAAADGDKASEQQTSQTDRETSNSQDLTSDDNTIDDEQCENSQLELLLQQYDLNGRRRLLNQNNVIIRNQELNYELLGGLVKLLVDQGETCKLSKSPQISGFQISIGKLLDEYMKQANSLILLEKLKMKITQIIVDELKKLDQ